MDVVIITALVGLIGTLIANFFATLKENKNIKQTKEDLSKEHANIKEVLLKENNHIFQGIRLVDVNVEKVFSKVDKINTTMIEEKDRREKLYSSLNKNEKEIKVHLDGLNGFWDIVSNLKAENKMLQLENKKLINRIAMLEEYINDKETKNKRRYQEMER